MAVFRSSVTSSKTGLARLLPAIISDRSAHTRWLNSLSYLENVGARKISASQDSELVTEEILRHTVEEARHAWYLKRQIQKIDPTACPTYERRFLVAGSVTRNYLHRLDVDLSRLTKDKLGYSGAQLRYSCYQLVTYAIEVRADKLYQAYEHALKVAHSSVSVRSILQEEENHLLEIVESLGETFEDADWWMKQARGFEQPLFEQWIRAVADDVELR